MRVSIVSITRIGLRLAFGAALLGGSVQAQTDDHLQCYQVKGDLRLKGFVDIETPQFGLAPGCKITKPKFFCAPATKNSLAVVDSSTKQPITPLPFSAPPAPGDRICWKVKCPSAFPSDQVVTDQFGTQTLTKFRTRFLCTPAVKGTEFCGDGSINGSEDCEPADPGGETCVSQGFANGTLACAADCAFDTSGCDRVALPATGQVTCWDSSGSVVPCAGTGHDGDIQAGAQLSYEDNGDGTITDQNTGLMWEKKSRDGTIHDYTNQYSWANAFAVHLMTLNSSAFAGYTDWRVPNHQELVSILDLERISPSVHPVFNTACAPGCNVTSCSCTRSDNHWSSTSDAHDGTRVWDMDFTNGDSDNNFKTNFFPVRAVRGGL